jgi:uncharacterized protein YPO0396
MELYTKKDFEKEFGISDNTVYTSLKACLLNTGKKKYSQAEHDRFALCRQMYEEGKSTDEIQEYFLEVDKQTTMHQQQEQPQEQQQQQAPKPKLDPSTSTTQKAQDTAKDFDSLVALTVHNFVERGVKKVAPHIPDMVIHSLSNHLDPEQIMQALNDIFQQAADNNQDTDTDFLHPIIEIPSPQPQKLPQQPKPAQLPQSSQENLDELS